MCASWFSPVCEQLAKPETVPAPQRDSLSAVAPALLRTFISGGFGGWMPTRHGWGTQPSGRDRESPVCLPTQPDCRANKLRCSIRHLHASTFSPENPASTLTEFSAPPSSPKMNVNR